jgi:DNA-binding beta-propeller fold protein YncE
MEVNGGSCSYCVNWADVGDEYYLQIETYDEQHGKYIDGVEISAKIISKGGELRHDFGEVATEDGIYKNSIIIPSMDWYAGNILSVTGTYYDVEKTIEKEFEVFKNQGGGSSGSSGSGGSGLKMFIVGNNGDDIIEYTLAAAWDVSSASFVDSFSIASQDGMPSGVAFGKSGEKMFVVGNDNDSVFEYTLATAWDVSSASFVDSFSIASQESSPSDLIFSKSGEKMFIVGNNGDEVNEYTLATAWDVSSASFKHSFSVASQDIFPTGIAFSKSGEKMFIAGAKGDDIIEYTLAAAWDVSSASFVDSFSVASQESSPMGIAFSKSGEKMFVAGNDNDSIFEYKLTTAWDVSSASFVDSFSVADYDTAPNGMFL